MTQLGITGATGTVGGGVAAQLHQAGLRPRLLVRDPSRAPAWAQDVATASYGDRDAALKALTGVDVLLMVSATESADRLAQHLTLVDAAAEAGVRHVVYTSFLGASPTATFTFARTHAATEEHLRASGMTTTMLRDSFYLDFLPDLSVDGVIAGPAGDGRVAAVAQADVIDVAASVLRHLADGDHRHDNVVYQLTGPQALSLDEVAEILTAAGRPTVYRPETVEQAYASRAGYGAPDWEVDGWVTTYTAIAAGEVSLVTDDVEQVTGHPPQSLAQLLAAS